MRSSPVFRLLPQESRNHEPWVASPDLGTDPPLRLGLGPRQPTGMPLTSADALSSRATEPASWTQLCPAHRLRSADSSECERRMAFAGLTMDTPPQLEEAEAELPRSPFLERHRLLQPSLWSRKL